MPNPNGARGYRWERALVLALAEAGLDVYRQRQHGARDEGDLGGLALFALEAKDEASIRLAAYVDQANAEARNAAKPYGVALVKRRGKGPLEGYAVMDVRTFAEVARRVESAEALQGLLDAIH